MSLDELTAALKGLLDTVSGENRELNPDEEARCEELTGQIHAAKKTAQVRSEALELLKPARTDLHVFAGAAGAGSDEVEKRFETFLRTGGQVNGAEFRAQSEGSGSAGGFLVPTTYRDKLVERRKAFGGFQTVAGEITTSSGQPLEWPGVDDTANIGGIVAENAAYPGADGADGVFTIKNLGAYKYGSGGAGSLPLKVSLELLQDSAFDVKGWITRALGTRIARAQAPHWLTGNGVGQPEGLLTNKTVTTTIASTTVPTYAELVTFVHALDPAYREGSVFVMNDASVAALQGIVDTTGRPLLQGLDQGTLASELPQQSLLGYRIVIDQAMPSIAASGSTKWLAFGLMSEAYVIRRVLQTQLVILNELFAANGQVGFLAYERADGCVSDANSYVVLGSHT